MIRRFLPISFSVLLLLPSCTPIPGEGGAPPSLMKPFVDFPGGSVVRFRDEDTAHILHLRDNGTYRMESMGMYDGMAASREGGWGWGKLGSHHAELTLDEEKWRLSFVSPESAVAYNENGGKTFAFQFERD